MDRMDNSEDSLSFHLLPLRCDPKLTAELKAEGISEPDDRAIDNGKSSNGVTVDSCTMTGKDFELLTP